MTTNIAPTTIAPTATGSRQYRLLATRLATVREVMALSPNPTDRHMQNEQDAYDALIAYIDETPGYTWSHLDPRGTWAEYLAEQAV